MVEFLDEQSRTIEKGSRKAVVTYRQYDKGWEIWLIKEYGWPDMGDSDSLFPTLELAEAEARRMWP